mgnify:FL=1
MIDWVLGLLPQYGIFALFCLTFVSCLGIPIPSSFALLLAGSFAAVGDFDLVAVLSAGLSGAIAGDQAGYLLGRWKGRAVLQYACARPWLKTQIRDATGFSARRGVWAVFFSRWLVSPLGPAINLLSGSLPMAWWGFALASMAGELVWVGMYAGLGYAFNTQIQLIGDILGNTAWLLAALLILVLLGRRLLRHMNHADMKRS